MVEIGKKYNMLTVLEKLDNGKYRCKCDCGNETTAYSWELTGKRQKKSCGCYHRMKLSKNIAGERFGKLIAIKLDHFEHGRSYWLCKCDCGNTKVIPIKSLLSGHTKSCGCTNMENITGNVYGKLKVINYAYTKNNKRYWKCKCDCGNIVYVNTSSLTTGNTKSCGCTKHVYIHKHKDYLGSKFGMITPIKYVGNSYWLCKCDCGNTKIIKSYDFLNGRVKSCGCNNLASYGSVCEQEIKYYINKLFPKLLVEKTRILDGKEIDIYIPELKIGIEYNGSAFHASENAVYNNKDVYYHRNKFLLARSKGIHLISVFDIDYEHNKNNILNIIRDTILNNYNIKFKSNIEYTNNDYECVFNYDGYVEVGQEEPSSYQYNGFKVYRCGRTIWKKEH